ncbi:MAG: glutamate 5-kinase [Methylotenera sp.]|nr:glutamate 5-kinase [Oligoflexia bacterium]
MKNQSRSPSKNSHPKKLRRWVVKAGSNMVCSGGPILLRAWMQQVKTLRKEHDIEVIWVTSGAIASAVDRTGFGSKKRLLAEKQALSAIGQPLIMDLYNLSLQSVGLLGAQVLLTYDDLADPKRSENFKNTLEQLLQWQATPILNENDAVATEEIKFGDNDALSAKVARTMGAERLVILTDVDGLHDEDPRRNSKAKLIHQLNGIAPAQLAKLRAEAESTKGNGGGTSRGTGGMYSKLSAADLSTRAGVETWLVKGDVPSVLLQVAKDQAVGTQILVKKAAKRSSQPARKSR